MGFDTIEINLVNDIVDTNTFTLQKDASKGKIGGEEKSTYK